MMTWAVRYSRDGGLRCRGFTTMRAAIEFFFLWPAGSVKLWRLDGRGFWSMAHDR